MGIVQQRYNSFWSTVSPFMTDKKHRNGNSFMLQENYKIVVEDKLVANIFLTSIYVISPLK